jgi:DNA-binding response OmpR family regulator
VLRQLEGKIVRGAVGNVEVSIDEGTKQEESKNSTNQILESRLRALEHGQATILEHLVMIRAAARTAGRGTGQGMDVALARIEELEIRLEDALAPPEPLPVGLDRKLSPVRCKIYALLKRKAQVNPEGFVHKDAMISALYGLSDEVPSTKALHVHIFHLRRKLPSHETVESVWGQGWRLVTTGKRPPAEITQLSEARAAHTRPIVSRA